MLLEYREIIVAAYSWFLWPLLLTGFALNKDANVRWFLLGFILITLLSVFSGKLIKASGAPSWVFHLSKIGIAYLVMQWVLYRPKLSVIVGTKLHRFPIAAVSHFVAVCLPAKYTCKLVPAELAIRKLYMAIIVVQLAVLANYFLAKAGVTNAGGLLDVAGYNRLMLWDAAYSSYLIFLVLELLLLVIVVLGGVKSQFKA